MEDEFSLICGEIIRSLDEIIGLVLVWVRFMWRLKAKGCRSAPKAPSTLKRSSNVGLFCPIFAHARSETEEDLYNHTGQKMITGPMHIKYANMQWHSLGKLQSICLPCSSSPAWAWLLPDPGAAAAAQAHLPHLWEGSPDWRHEVRFLSCSYSVFQLWNLDSNVLHQRFPRWKFLFEKLSIRLLQLNLEPT